MISCDLPNQQTKLFPSQKASNEGKDQYSWGHTSRNLIPIAQPPCPETCCTHPDKWKLSGHVSRLQRDMKHIHGFVSVIFID